MDFSSRHNLRDVASTEDVKRLTSSVDLSRVVCGCDRPPLLLAVCVCVCVHGLGQHRSLL